MLWVLFIEILNLTTLCLEKMGIFFLLILDSVKKLKITLLKPFVEAQLIYLLKCLTNMESDLKVTILLLELFSMNSFLDNLPFFLIILWVFMKISKDLQLNFQEKLMRLQKIFFADFCRKIQRKDWVHNQYKK